MSQQYISNRVIFPRSGDQRSFLINNKKALNVTWNGIAHLLKLNPRTVRDWVREEHHMSYFAVRLLTQKTAIKLPQSIKIKNWKEHLSCAGRAGGKALVRKHGGRVAKDEKNRQEKWQEWWQRVGQYKPNPIYNPLPIKKPEYSSELAEFVGIMLGDGGISQKQVTVTMHRFDDRLYRVYVTKIIQNLFAVPTGLYRQKNAFADTIVVSRVKLVRFCLDKLGLKCGNKLKQGLDIPTWIKSSPGYQVACLRGLVDTDGCIFTHHYRVKNKIYTYKKLNFCSHSLDLCLSVKKILNSLGIKSRLAGGRNVRIDSRKDMQKYFKIVGSHNPKHLKHYIH